MRRTLAVGLGGDGIGQALAWALQETVTAGGRLLLCHACPPRSALAGAGPGPPIGLIELVDPPLARAIAQARTRVGGHRVTVGVRADRAGALLLDAAQTADLLVIGASGRGGGHLARELAAHAPCPVVVVRPTTDHDGPFAGQVVVGVEDSAASRAALEFAFAHADAHRCLLAAVHVHAHGRPDRARSDLAAQIEPWTHKYPGVPVQQALLPGHPLPGLLRAAAGARLLVLGDHTQGAAARALLGSVSRGAVDHAPCTTAVVRDWEQRGGP